MPYVRFQVVVSEKPDGSTNRTWVKAAYVAENDVPHVGTRRAFAIHVSL